ncbi:MAG: mandelate racemase/muconate lactonizing enzyme family protein, partial [Chloroflexi bacterium]|nr:mandelate racemase/muconate lactonizing enzyme family protein [Chloroflexota bacterium]
MDVALSDTTIESIEVIPIRVGLVRLYQGSHYQMPNRCTIVTRMRTSGGLVSEIYNADEDEPQEEIVNIIRKELAPILVGMDALDTERCWNAMSVILKDQLRNRWRAVQAIACMDSAIWDLVGKALDVPLYRLWGGFRDRVPMIGIGGYYTDDPDSIEKELAFFAGAGMVGMKFKIGKRSPAQDAERLRCAVSLAPEGFTFIVDANQAWTVAEALEFVDRTKDFVTLRWFEEPCLWPNDHDLMRLVRHKANVPIAAGQMEHTRIGMRKLIEGGSIDVSNFDASWGGGPTEWRRVAAIALSHGVQMGHHEEAQV